MKNVTISLDEELARWARVRAAERDMSLSRYLAEILREQRTREEGYAAAMDGFLARAPVRLRRGRKKAPYPSREALHER